MADNGKDNPDVWCLPIGLMQYHNHPQPRQIVQAKNLMLITYESNYGLRYIYMDGRPAPNNDPTPWWFGYSRGWWEGDTLVVETTNFHPLQVFRGASENLKVIERFARTGPDTILYKFTIDDPSAFVSQWSGQIPFNRMDDLIYEYGCHEGNYALANVLSGERDRERREAEKKKQQ